jgi:hypothetical protein
MVADPETGCPLCFHAPHTGSSRQPRATARTRATAASAKLSSSVTPYLVLPPEVQVEMRAGTSCGALFDAPYCRAVPFPR